MTSSAIYAGDVVHVRTRPRRHRLHYRVFSLLLDLDELPALSRSLRLFGFNRRAVFSFNERDHGDGSEGGLRRWVEAQLAETGVNLPGPVIRVLCYPRIWGYVFNPLTVFFCSDRNGVLHTILYEVCNTFGERMTYVIPAAADNGGSVRHGCRKLHYVSPFVPMDAHYRFHILPPTQGVSIRIDESDSDGFFLRAVFAGRRQPLTDRTLLRMLVTYPLMTLKVTAAIHWEALRLGLKGVPMFRHHRAPQRIASTVVGANPSANHAAGDRQTERVGE